jgi:alginate O-acetyltransferase complex protein AlgI
VVFSSLSYLLFLWTAYVLYWTLRNRRPLAHAVLLLASYWFYGHSHWSFLALLVASTVLDFFAGLAIHAAHERGNPKAAKRWLLLSLAGNLGMLGTFKYHDFFVDGAELLLSGLGVDAHLVHLDLLLPLGISFYTFQTLSYTIDLYRRQLQPTRNFVDFALYVAFFPQLIAGPIVRAVDFLPQLLQWPPLTRQRVGSGLFLILQGLVKKLLVADLLGAHFVDPVMADAAMLPRMDGLGVLLLGYAFALQLYGDFAGYSDIAIGSARLLGYELTINFDSPFKSTSLDEFWRRWHISMSTWFRDYVFHPLGGSQRGLARTCLNTFVTFVLIGLWHGAAWTYVLYGAAQGLGLVVTRVWRERFPDAGFRRTALWAFLGFLLTWHWVALLGLLYRAPDHGSWLVLMSRLSRTDGAALNVPWQIWLILAGAFATHLMPQAWVDRVERAWCRLSGVAQALLLVAAVLLLQGVHPRGIVPFVYFQF